MLYNKCLCDGPVATIKKGGTNYTGRGACPHHSRVSTKLIADQQADPVHDKHAGKTGIIWSSYQTR